MGKILGIIVTSELEEEGRVKALVSLVEELLEVAKSTSKQITLENHQGCVQALGYIIGRLCYRHPYTWTSYISPALASTMIQSIAEDLDASAPLRIQGACVALAEAGRYAPLPIAQDDEKEESTASMDVDEKETTKESEGAATTPNTATAGTPSAPTPTTPAAPAIPSTPHSSTPPVVWSRQKIVKKLISIAKTTKDSKIQESSLVTLGHLALGTPTLTESVLNFLYTLPSIFTKQVEVHFTIGEVLCTIGGGWEAANMKEFLDIADVVYPPSSHKEAESRVGNPDEKVMEGILEKCIKEVQPGGRPVVRKAVCVWMLCLVKYCGEHVKIKTNLAKIHSAFSSLLADRDEFTQEVASKGIGIVYESGDENLKKELVGSLVSTFTEGRRIAPQSVTADTTLFDANTIGASPDGTSLTTYQSILSLASDMNQPDLVYRFMNLASHHAIWNSRRGASMGFGNILAHAEEELKPYLPQLVPKLYRFQFDPNVKVADAMRSIWKALVKEPKKAVDEYFEVIVKDVLKGFGDRQWRTREASCAALTDLLHGRQLTQIEPYLQELWTMCFRALDDIKESVRTAALTTCKTLTNLTVRYCDPHAVSVTEGQKIMDIVMPFFLTKGLGSMAEDVRKFSLSTILKITKKGGVLLKPHLVDLVSTLLESLSSLEPQAMNYLSFHTEKYGITQEQLDSTRLTAAKMSPMMDAVDTCIEQIDAKILASLVPKLNTIVRKGVGLPTKAGSARFIVSLCVRVPLDLAPHADSVLQALSGAISDRSPAVRKSFATAVGYMARLASENALRRLITHITKMYTENDDNEIRSVPAIVILECARHARDNIKNFSSEILPLAYFGSRDANETIQSTWKDAWEETTAGSSSGAVKMYLPEIMRLVEALLKESPSWTIKRQVGAALSDAAKLVEGAFLPYMDAALPMLIEGLAGRTWEGKEAVLDALITVCVTCKEYFEEGKNSERLEEIIKVVIREAKKNNKPYRRQAIELLGRFFDELQIDRFGEVVEYLTEMATMDVDGGGGGNGGSVDAMDVDEMREKPLALATKANAFKAIGMCWPKNKAATQAQHSRAICQLLTTNVDGNVWNVRAAVLNALYKYVDRLAFTEMQGDNVLVPSSEILDVSMVHSLCGAAFKALEDTKYTAIREAAAKVLKRLVERVNGTLMMTADIKSELLAKLDTVCKKELVPSIEEVLKMTRKMLSDMEVE
ncbi:hypothetical protein HK102_001737 [Quaeritorhiza haematococci]|nr:hypothetical protein HK102_001737 [Quaeritorhiza haematococci]